MAEANFDEMNVNEVLESVEKGDISAEEALEVEQKGKNRSTLVDALNDIINSDSDKGSEDDDDQGASHEEGLKTQSNNEEDNDSNNSSDDQDDSDEPTADEKESNAKKTNTPKKKKVKLAKNIKYKGQRYKIGETIKIDVKDLESFAENELIESE